MVWCLTISLWALVIGTTNALVKTKHKTSAFGIELNARACQQPLMVCTRSPTPVLLATLSDGLARGSKATSQSYFQSIKYSIKIMQSVRVNQCGIPIRSTGIDFPYSFACRTVDPSIKSPQSNHRAGHQIFDRLMSPVFSVLDFYSSACRAVESPIESSQSNRRASLQIFNRLMSPVFSVLDCPITVHAAQSSRQSSRHNRVAESVCRNFPVD
jgi:hypothetical protein